MRNSSGKHDARLLVTSSFQAMFRIEALLGEGGMGRVYAAYDVNLDRDVAIKVLHEHTARDRQIAARFVREAKVMARLSSIHTVRVHGIGRNDEGAPYIVMERVSGKDVDSLVEEQGPLLCDEAVVYVRQACEAIAEAHVKGIVHRDIKPANVLVSSSPTGEPLVKVVDFGVAKEDAVVPPGASGLTSLSALLGTPEYMSPEQLRSPRDVDHRTDIWSLGATLFFMLAGRAPFSGRTLGELMHHINHAPTPSVRALRPDVPASIDEAIARCLHRDPLGRYRTVGDLVAALGGAHGSNRHLADTPSRPFEVSKPIDADDTGQAQTILDPRSDDEIEDKPDRTVAMTSYVAPRPPPGTVALPSPLPPPPPVPAPLPPVMAAASVPSSRPPPGSWPAAPPASTPPASVPAHANATPRARGIERLAAVFVLGLVAGGGLTGALAHLLHRCIC